MLSQFATIDEVKAAIEGVKVVSLDKPGKSSTVHWRIGDAKGNQVVLEFVDGVPHFYDNKTKRLSRKEQPFYIFYSRRFYFRCNYFSQADCNLQPLI